MEPAGILLLIGFPVGPALLGFYAWRKTRGRDATQPAKKAAFWPGVLNASLFFALAFNLVYFVQEFFLAWPKSLLPGVEAVVYHNNHNWAGDHPQLMLYQGAGALAIIVMGFMDTAIGVSARNRLGNWHPMLWWSACMALALGLVQVSIAAMHPDNDVGQALDYLALSSGVRFALALGSTTAAIVFGIYFARPLLAMAPPGTVESARSRVIYVLKFAIVPMLAGTVIAWANRAPPVGQLTMPLFSALFILPWTLAAAAITPAPLAVTDRLHRGVDWTLIGVSALVCVLFQTVLASGLAV